MITNLLYAGTVMFHGENAGVYFGPGSNPLRQLNWYTHPLWRGGITNWLTAVQCQASLPRTCAAPWRLRAGTGHRNPVVSALRIPSREQDLAPQN